VRDSLLAECIVGGWSAMRAAGPVPRILGPSDPRIPRGVGGCRRFRVGKTNSVPATRIPALLGQGLAGSVGGRARMAPSRLPLPGCCSRGRAPARLHPAQARWRREDSRDNARAGPAILGGADRPARCWQVFRGFAGEERGGVGEPAEGHIRALRTTSGSRAITLR
jgi:hypothetical protein